MSMTRNEFLRSVLGVGVGAATVALVAGCGDDGAATADAGNTCTSPANQIGTNHGHTLTITLADVDAAVAKTYDITGTAGHAHTLTITPQQFMQIKEGRTLNIESSNGLAHTHTITVMCVS